MPTTLNGFNSAGQGWWSGHKSPSAWPTPFTKMAECIFTIQSVELSSWYGHSTGMMICPRHNTHRYYAIRIGFLHGKSGITQTLDFMRPSVNPENFPISNRHRPDHRKIAAGYRIRMHRIWRQPDNRATHGGILGHTLFLSRAAQDGYCCPDGPGRTLTP